MDDPDFGLFANLYADASDQAPDVREALVGAWERSIPREMLATPGRWWQVLGSVEAGCALLKNLVGQSDPRAFLHATGKESLKGYLTNGFALLEPKRFLSRRNENWREIAQMIQDAFTRYGVGFPDARDLAPRSRVLETLRSPAGIQAVDDLDLPPPEGPELDRLRTEFASPPPIVYHNRGGLITPAVLQPGGGHWQAWMWQGWLHTRCLWAHVLCSPEPLPSGFDQSASG